ARRDELRERSDGCRGTAACLPALRAEKQPFAEPDTMRTNQVEYLIGGAGPGMLRREVLPTGQCLALQNGCPLGDGRAGLRWRDYLHLCRDATGAGRVDVGRGPVGPANQTPQPLYCIRKRR